MQLKDFEYLMALAEEKSVSKAAERLYMAQSSLSQFLSQYEADLGIKLFIRTSKGIHLTNNGEIYLERLSKIIADYQRAQNELWDNENMKGGRVSLGISSFRGERMLPKILHRFYDTYPNVKVDVIEENSLALEDYLIEGTLDVGVIVLPATKHKGNVKFLKKDEVYVIAPKQHPIMQYVHPKTNSHGFWVNLKDVARYDLILSYYDTILGTISRNLLSKNKLKYHALHDNITAQMAVSMTIEGLGLSFTYASCTPLSDRYELLSIGEDGVFIDLGIAFPAKEYHSMASQKMEEIIRGVYNDYGQTD